MNRRVVGSMRKMMGVVRIFSPIMAFTRRQLRKSYWRIQVTIPAVVATSIVLDGAPARAYDMDCKVILCLAAGFPNGCGDARSYMVRRLKKGRGPFGTCSGGSSDGVSYDVPVRMFTRKIQPVCTAWQEDRDGRYCAASIPGREEGVIRVSILQDFDRPDYENEFIGGRGPGTPPMMRNEPVYSHAIGGAETAAELSNLVTQRWDTEAK